MMGRRLQIIMRCIETDFQLNLKGVTQKQKSVNIKRRHERKTDAAQGVGWWSEVVGRRLHMRSIFNLLKGVRSYFSKLVSLFHLQNRHSKDVNFKFQLKRSSRLDL